MNFKNLLIGAAAVLALAACQKGNSNSAAPAPAPADSTLADTTSGYTKGTALHTFDFAGRSLTIDGMATWHPDVILMDIGLPDVDGVEVARRLQDRVDVETPPIVLISTRDVAYGERLATTVAAGYLPKDGLSLAAILRIIST